MILKIIPNPKRPILVIERILNQQKSPLEQIINDIEKDVSTRSSLKNACANLAFIFQIEPKLSRKPKRMNT